MPEDRMSLLEGTDNGQNATFSMYGDLKRSSLRKVFCHSFQKRINLLQIFQIEAGRIVCELSK